MDFAISSTFHLSNIEVEDLGFEGEKGLLEQLSSSEQLLAALRSLTRCLVLAPALDLAGLTAVESRAWSASMFGFGATRALSSCRLAAGRADATRRVLRGHGGCGVARGGGTKEKVAKQKRRHGSFKVRWYKRRAFA